MDQPQTRNGTTRRLTRRNERNKKYLPVVTEVTIREVIRQAEQDKDPLFHRMAAGNPTLYRFLYTAYQQEEVTKEVMFGLLIGTYAMLEEQMNTTG